MGERKTAQAFAYEVLDVDTTPRYSILLFSKDTVKNCFKTITTFPPLFGLEDDPTMQEEEEKKEKKIRKAKKKMIYCNFLD
jgi:hypothetical protein